MTLLIIGIVVFLGLHLLPTVSGWREKLFGRLGENGYKTLFSLLSIAGVVLLIYGFAKAQVIQVWSPPGWTWWVAIVLMLPAFIFWWQLMCRARSKRSSSIPSWSRSRPGRSLTSSPDLASIILFGSFLAYAVYDRITLKRRPATGLVTAAATRPPRNDHRRGCRHPAFTWRSWSGCTRS